MAESPAKSSLRAPPDLASDLSPSSAESNFRELDDAFLQTQTRIWLGEVLQKRLNEQKHISDLLANGELLFEVSDVISKMLPTPPPDAAHLKVNEWKSVASSKSTRRYKHYDHVDSFLMMCKYLGLDGIDLFSPSDVFEKRNTRKVCMCIRSLSKKARSRDLNVPDYDSVTSTLSMPTYMVKRIRNSLELSQCSSSLSIGCDSEEVAMSSPDSASAISNGHSSDNCDDAESKFMVAQSNGTSDNACGAMPPKFPYSQLVRDCSLGLELHSNDEELENEENEVCEYLSPVTESIGSPCSQYHSDEESSRILCSMCVGSRISGNILHGNNETEYGRRTGDVSHIPIDWGETSLDVGNYSDGDANKSETDTACRCSCSLTGEKKTCNAPIENSSYLSEIDSEKSSSYTNKQAHCENSFSVQGRNLDLPLECAVEYDFCAAKALIPMIESPNSDADGFVFSGCSLKL